MISSKPLLQVIFLTHSEWGFGPTGLTPLRFSSRSYTSCSLILTQRLPRWAANKACLFTKRLLPMVPSDRSVTPHFVFKLKKLASQNSLQFLELSMVAPIQAKLDSLCIAENPVLTTCWPLSWNSLMPGNKEQGMGGSAHISTDSSFRISNLSHCTWHLLVQHCSLTI